MMMIKKRSLFVLLILLLPLLMVGHVGADETKTVLTIEGDDLIIDTVNEISTFIGNVNALYGEYKIQGQKLLYDQKRQNAKIEGTASLTGDQLRVLAQTIEVDLVNEFLTMTGNVEVYREGQLVKGSEVTYNMQTKALKVKNAHVEITETNK